MNKRQAKSVIYSFLMYQLDPANIDGFLRVESMGKSADYQRLVAASEEVQQEMLRRAAQPANKPTGGGE